MKWRRKPCGCVNTKLPSVGRATIRCARHRGQPAKKGRTLAHWDEHGLARHG